MYIYIIAIGKREMRRTRYVVIRLKGQHTVNLLSQSKEEKKRRKEEQAFNLTSDYFDATRERNMSDFLLLSLLSKKRNIVGRFGVLKNYNLY